MKYILLYPKRIIDRIRYEINGTMPVVYGDEIRFGANDVKVIIGGDFVQMFPYKDVAAITMEEGFLQARKQAESEAAQEAASQFANIVHPGPIIDPENIPYEAPKTPPNMNDYM